ncbi:phosphoribosylanthranilate isomerase [Winogradskyella sp. 3972H.M.0a.05]|uniref:phosphoribosylanthranilate isomerase n=1 Tax=Winogradskyella sp. 3972H.M.0a.05 TaxID=2950277 RepID=UPI0033937628
MKLKICGMKHNTSEVAELRPDYLGFIFYDKSARHFEGSIPNVSESIKKVGVFVDAPIEFILNKINEHQLDAIQLHGHESPEYCKNLIRLIADSSAVFVEIIKVFSIKDDFDFSILKDYKDLCSYFLFDTKGKLPGGNGYTFDWNVLKSYPSQKPFFLSGGIGLDELENLKAFLKTDAAKYCYAIDVNSKFESEPGLKNIKELEQFQKELSFRA